MRTEINLHVAACSIDASQMQESRAGAIALVGMLFLHWKWHSGRLAALKVGLCHHTDLGERPAYRQASAEVRLYPVRHMYTAVQLSAQRSPLLIHIPTNAKMWLCQTSQLTTKVHLVLSPTVGLTLTQPPAPPASTDLRSLQLSCDAL